MPETTPAPEPRAGPEGEPLPEPSFSDTFGALRAQIGSALNHLADANASIEASQDYTTEGTDQTEYARTAFDNARREAQAAGATLEELRVALRATTAFAESLGRSYQALLVDHARLTADRSSSNSSADEGLVAVLRSARDSLAGGPMDDPQADPFYSTAEGLARSLQSWAISTRGEITALRAEVARLRPYEEAVQGLIALVPLDRASRE